MKILRHPLFMRPNPESELEQVIDRELRRLPDLTAPASLAPRVMQEIARRAARPWWQQSFASWPWSARLIFVAFSSGLAALLLYFSWGLSLGVSAGSLASEAGVLAGRFEFVGGVVRALSGALLLAARSANPALPWIVAGVAGSCYLTTVGLGTYLYRLAAQRT